MRGQKTSKEIKYIQKGPPERTDYKHLVRSVRAGSRIVDEIFRELLKILQSRFDLTELGLARQIRKLAKDKGADGMAFRPIVSFGKSAAQIHHVPSAKKIGKNNFLMLDYGVKIRGYCSDFTRTLFLGKPNKFQKKIYNIVLKAQLAALKKIKIGADCADVDLAARNIIASAGFARHYNHFTGHAVGQKIHEQPGFTPTSRFQIPDSIVMTVEPGIYLPNKFGVRIEDMVLVVDKPRLRQGSGGQAKIFSKIPKDFKSMIIALARR